MRDKLIELIDNNKACPFDDLACCECEYSDITPCFAGRMADVLIANGVTFADVPDNNVGKWIPVSERLPKKTGYYFVHHKGGFVAERYFYEEAPEMFVPFGNEPVTHWMPLPEPPKEGE